MVLRRRAQQRAVVARRASEKGDSLEEREELQVVQAALLVDVQGVEQAAQDLRGGGVRRGTARHATTHERPRTHLQCSDGEQLVRAVEVKPLRATRTRQSGMRVRSAPGS